MKQYELKCLFSVVNLQGIQVIVWATSQENLSSRFATRVDSNRTAQL